MAGPMFGAGGFEQARKDIAARELSELSVVEKGLDVSGKMAEQEQKARLLQKLETAGGKPADTAPAYEHLSYMARVAGQSGYLDSASKLAKAGADLQKEALADKRERLEYGTNLLKHVIDQRSLDTANAIYRQRYGEPSPLEGVAYSPGLMRQVMDGIIKEQDYWAAEANKSHISLRKTQELLNKKRGDYLDARAKHIGKTGGKVVGAPTSGEILAANRLIAADFPNIDKTALQDAGFSVAAHAKALRTANPGLDAETSISRAYYEARASGDFASTEGIKIGGWKIGEATLPSVTFGGKTVFKGGGKASVTAMKLPDDPKNLVTGRYYVTPKGIGRFVEKDGKRVFEMLSTQVGLDEGGLDEGVGE